MSNTEIYININKENKLELTSFQKQSNNMYGGNGKLIYTLEKNYLDNIEIEYLLEDKEFDFLEKNFSEDILDDLDDLEKIQLYIDTVGENQTLSLDERINDALEYYAIDDNQFIDTIDNIIERLQGEQYE